MKRASRYVLCLIGLLCLLTGSVQAQLQKTGKQTAKSDKMGKMGGKSGKMGKTSGKTGKTAGSDKVSGIIKGAPSGTTFVIANKAGQTTVDASKAKIRNEKGQFAKADALKAGAIVQATGTKSGSNLVATEVTIKHSPGGSKSGSKAGGKMGGKMGKMTGSKMTKGGKKAMPQGADKSAK